MKRFISINNRSIGIYFFAILFCVFFSYSILCSNAYLLIVFTPVILWILISFNLILFSRCSFMKDKIVIRGDFNLDKRQQIQKHHIINYKDIDYCKLENLEKGYNSNNEILNLSNRRKSDYQFFYGYNTIKCITFYLNNATKKGLVVNRYSTKQINDMINILNMKNIDVTRFTDNQQYFPRESYPVYLRIVTTITIILFIGFSVYSSIIGGDSINGLQANEHYESYVAGNHYICSHGDCEQVTYTVWLTNLIFGIITIAMFLITLVLNVIYTLRNRI